jgi:hypothetical protein
MVFVSVVCNGRRSIADGSGGSADISGFFVCVDDQQSVSLPLSVSTSSTGPECPAIAPSSQLDSIHDLRSALQRGEQTESLPKQTTTTTTN